MTSPGGEKIDVTVDLNDKLSVPAREAAASIDDLGDQAKQAERRLSALQRQADRSGKSLEFLALKTRAADMAFRSQEERISFIADEWKKLTPQVEKATTAVKKNEKETKKNSLTWKGFLKQLGTFRKMSAGIPGQLFAIGKGLAAVLAVAGAASAVQNIFSIIQALSSLSALAAFIPTAISSLVSVMMTLKVAVSGVGTAIKDAFTGKLDKANAAFKKLSPSAQDFVKDIYDMQGAFKNLKKSVQENFFKPFAVFTKPTIQKSIIPITFGMRGIAKSAGYAVAQILLFFQSFRGQRLIINAFRAGQNLVDAFTKSIGPLLNGISAVMDVIAPFWYTVTGFLGDLGAKFGKWMQQISDSGQLENWVNMAVGVLKQLGGIIGQLFGIFKGLFAVIGDNKGLTPFLTFLQEVNKWVNSTEGQAALLSFFSSLTSLIPVLTPLLKIVADTIGTVLAPAILGIVQGLAPGFMVFLQALAAALKVIAPYFPPLAAALGGVLAALAPLLQPLSQLVTIIAIQLANGLKILTPFISILVNALGALLGPVLTVIIGFFEQLSPYIPQIADAFAQFGAVIVPIFAEIGSQLASALLPLFQQFMTDTLPQLLPLLVQLGQAFSDFILVALQQLLPYLPPMIKAWTETLAAILPLLPTLVQLAIYFLNLVTALTPVLVASSNVVSAFVNMDDRLKGAFADVKNHINSFMDKVAEIRDRITRSLSGVEDLFAEPFRRGYEKVKQIIDDIKNVVSNANISSLVSGALNALNPFRFAGGPVEGGQAYTVGEIGKEMFVPDVGTPKVIGASGMDENWRAPGKGMIVPNYMLDMMDNNAAMMRKQAAKQEKAALPGLARKESHTHYHRHEGDHLDATFTGDMTSNVDIERAMGKFYRRMKTEEAERR